MNGDLTTPATAADRATAEQNAWRRIRERALPEIDTVEKYRQAVAEGMAMSASYLRLQGEKIPTTRTMSFAHRVMFQGAMTDAGKFRRGGQESAYQGQPGAHPVRIGTEIAMLEKQTEQMMEEARTQEDYCVAAAFYHSRFASIQPFQDGNNHLNRMNLRNQLALGGVKLNTGELRQNRAGYEQAMKAAMEQDDIGPLSQVVAECSGLEHSLPAKIPAPWKIAARPALNVDDREPLIQELEKARTGVEFRMPSQRPEIQKPKQNGPALSM